MLREKLKRTTWKNSLLSLWEPAVYLTSDGACAALFLLTQRYPTGSCQGGWKLEIRRHWVMQQHNDPEHWSKSTTQWFRKLKSHILKCPSQRPELHLIETLWNDLKRAVQTDIREYEMNWTGQHTNPCLPVPGDRVTTSGHLWVLQQ